MKVSGKSTPFIWGARSASGLVILLIFCCLFGAITATGGPAVLSSTFKWIAATFFNNQNPPSFDVRPSAVPLAMLGIFIGAIVGNRFIQGMERLGLQWENLETGDKVTLFVGTFAGMIAAVPILQVFQNLAFDPVARIIIIIGVTVGLVALSIYALQSMADILPWNRGRGRNRRSGIKILDTNVIIDGRIYDVAKSGFLDGQLYVPRFVLEELQFIADSSDGLRRARGRKGLETLKSMQAEFNVEVGTHDRFAPDASEEVDSRIVRVANALGADIVTNDYNLNQVATLQHLRVLSLNDLALALRTNVLPQETIRTKIIREGNQLGQGVGYLSDGTMIVVENGEPFIGQEAQVVVTQVIQTERGKMIFAEVESDEAPSVTPVHRRSSGRRP